VSYYVGPGLDPPVVAGLSTGLWAEPLCVYSTLYAYALL
jgi:hypothetical protein